MLTVAFPELPSDKVFDDAELANKRMQLYKLLYEIAQSINNSSGRHQRFFFTNALPETLTTILHELQTEVSMAAAVGFLRQSGFTVSGPGKVGRHTYIITKGGAVRRKNEDDDV